MKYDRRLPKPIMAAAVLMILVAISAYLCGGRLARYVVGGSGNASVAVASFGVEAAADESSAVYIVSDGGDVNAAPRSYTEAFG